VTQENPGPCRGFFLRGASAVSGVARRSGRRALQGVGWFRPVCARVPHLWRPREVTV